MTPMTRKRALAAFVAFVLGSLALEPAHSQPARGTVREASKQRLDPTPRATQKPYSPADGQVVEITPPPFIWVPAGRGAVYVLQVSPTSDFSNGKTRTVRGLRRPVHVLREPLPAGDWHWRYGVETSDGVVYGRPRPFTVPASARPFSFPDFDEIVKRTPRKRPRLFFPGERLERIRRAAGGELKKAVEQLVRRARRSIGEKLVPEPGYQPRDRSKRGPWAVNVMRTTRPPMDAMERCALAYIVTGDREAGLEAKRRLLHFFSWDPEGPTSFFAYDEPPMWVMMRGTRAYDWTYDLFESEERDRVERNMKARALQFLKRLEQRPFESNPYESHAGRLPGFLGECALSFIHEWPEAREWLEYATLLYYTSYPAWGGDDGGWQEGPGYWSAYMSFALHFVVALREATGIDLMRKPFFRNTPYYALYTATAYHEHSPFGDGHTGTPRRLGRVLYAFSTLTGDPRLRWYADAAGFEPGADILSLATYDPLLKAKVPLDLPQARVFPAVGLASLHTALGDRESDISFLLRSSPYGSVSHGHADQNAFVIEAFGRGLAIATGYYPWYGSPHHHNWTRATRAVNSILVNGEGQTIRTWEARGSITGFHQDSSYDFVEGEAAPAYSGRLQEFRRRVVHIRPGIFVLQDDLVAPQPSTFQWLLHAYERIQVDERTRTLRVERAPAAMQVHLVLPEKVTWTQTDRYDPEPENTKGRWENTWHLTASTVEPATRTRFLSVFLPHRVGNGAELPRIESASGQGAHGVCLEFSDGVKEVVAFRTDPGARTVTCAGLESDGKVFAAGQQSGRLIRRLVIGGTRVAKSGEEATSKKAVKFIPHRVGSYRGEACEVGDFNNDGKLDIVAGPYLYRAPDWKARKIRTLKGDVDEKGKGYRWDFMNLPLDIDGDGLLDVVSCSWFEKWIDWYRNLGATEGDWPQTVIEKNGNYETGDLWDIDGDGKALEILPHVQETFWYEVARGSDGKRTVIRHTVSKRPLDYGGGVGDVNGDGRPDILRPGAWYEAPTDPRQGKWKEHPLALGSLEEGKADHTPQICAYDVNGDGLNDLITSSAHKRGIFWYQQVRKGKDITWKRHLIDDSWSQAHSITLADLDEDGDLDLVTGKRFMAHNGGDPGAFEPLCLYWYELERGEQPSWIRHAISYDQGIGAGLSIPVTDMDRDGDLDVVVTGKFGGPVWFENRLR